MFRRKGEGSRNSAIAGVQVFHPVPQEPSGKGQGGEAGLTEEAPGASFKYCAHVMAFEVPETRVQILILAFIDCVTYLLGASTSSFLRGAAREGAGLMVVTVPHTQRLAHSRCSVRGTRESALGWRSGVQGGGGSWSPVGGR